MQDQHANSHTRHKSSYRLIGWDETNTNRPAEYALCASTITGPATIENITDHYFSTESPVMMTATAEPGDTLYIWAVPFDGTAATPISNPSQPFASRLPPAAQTPSSAAPLVQASDASSGATATSAPSATGTTGTTGTTAASSSPTSSTTRLSVGWAYFLLCSATVIVMM